MSWVFVVGLGLPSATGSDARGPNAILERVEALIGGDLLRWSHDAGVAYPPEVVVFRAFKREGELEIWAGAGAHPLRRVRTLPICAVVNERGPKLKPYDKRTPEGFYGMRLRFRSRLPWMWIKLEPDAMDRWGEVGDGSPFFLHLDYPNDVDRALSRAASVRVPRGEICMHGNCATEGCVSLSNRDYLFAYAFAAHHDERRYGRVQIHLLPFRFDSAWNFDEEAGGYVHLGRLGRRKLRAFWENLREGYEWFERHRRPVRFVISNGRYVFGLGER